MANQGSEHAGGQQWPGKDGARAGRAVRPAAITVAGKPVATLVVEGIYVALIPDTHGPARRDRDMRRRRDDAEAAARRAESVHRVDASGWRAWPANRGFATRVALGPAGRIAVRG